MNRLGNALLISALAYFARSGLVAQTTVFNETWVEGNRTTQNPPQALRWFISSSSAPVSTVAGGACTIGGGRSLTAYFPSQTIAAGGALTLTFNFSLVAPLVGSSNGGTSSGLRWGLFSSGGASANIFTSDGQNGSVTSTGYMATVDINPNPGELGATGLALDKRFALANSIVTTTGTVSVLPLGTAPGPVPLIAGSAYTCVMTLQYSVNGVLLVSYKLTGPGLPGGYTASFEDDGNLAAPTGAPAAPAPFTTFDTVSLDLASSPTNAASAMTLGPVSLVYSAPGSSGTVTSQPSTQTVNSGANVSFSAAAAGSGNSYQWMFNGAAIPGATATSLSLNGVQAFNAGGYVLVVTNAGTSLSSARADLIVNPAGTLPLNSAFVPGKNFNLGGFTLELPVSSQDPTGVLSLLDSVTEFTGAALAGYTSTYFFTDPTDGAMRFYAPITGDRLGSNFPRSELREAYTPSQADWYDTYGTAILNASLKVNQVPLGTTKITIGQIKADSGVQPAINIMTELFYDSTSIYANVNYQPAVDNVVQLVFPNGGSPGSGVINYQLKMVPGAVFITINGTTKAMVLDQTAATGWPTAPVYFKAGDYVQANPSTEGTSPPASDGGSTSFYSLVIDHINSAMQVATTSLPSGTPGLPYSQTLQTANASGAISWSLVSGVIGVAGGGTTAVGSLPAGLSLSPGGVISGTPQASDALGNYSNIVVAATDATGATAIQNLSLSLSPVSFATQPVSQSIQPGSTVVFNAAASASSTYQWQLNGAAIAGATNPRLVVSNSQVANTGNYTVTATNSSGTATSAPAALSLASTSNPGRLINLSVNTNAGKSQILTIGFVVGGAGTAGTEPLLVRADGPALAAFGSPNTLVDPTLNVFSGQTLIASNDNWNTPATNGAAVTAADTATFAFPLTNAASLDAALTTSLAVSPGYTAEISGNTAASGAVLAELYDNTATYTATSPRLINVSSNENLAAGGTLTVGFSIAGTTSKTVLIRASGPQLALAPFNLSGTMADPQLVLHQAASILASNAGWGGDPQITAVANSVFAFTLTVPTSNDAVILMTLPPGVYSAVAQSASGGGGTVIVEVYEVP